MATRLDQGQNSTRRNPLTFAVSMLALLAAWVALAALRGDPAILPMPQAVAAILWDEAVAGRL